jgi:hypothetical protein
MKLVFSGDRVESKPEMVIYRKGVDPGSWRELGFTIFNLFHNSSNALAVAYSLTELRDTKTSSIHLGLGVK